MIFFSQAPYGNRNQPYQDACEEALQRIISKNKNLDHFQVAYIAMNKAGETGSYCIHPGFARMEYKHSVNTRIESKAYLTS
jgi:N4-(beta-N-acetylglucosaminyl)-L-asparaginase